jgi:hypothetical protein
MTWRGPPNRVLSEEVDFEALMQAMVWTLLAHELGTKLRFQDGCSLTLRVGSRRCC